MNEVNFIDFDVEFAFVLWWWGVGSHYVTTWLIKHNFGHVKKKKHNLGEADDKCEENEGLDRGWMESFLISGYCMIFLSGVDCVSYKETTFKFKYTIFLMHKRIFGWVVYSL